MMTACPLCQKRFEGREACNHCGLVKNCTLLRCPHCGYEFVEDSVIAAFLARTFKRIKGEKTNGALKTNGVLPLTEASLACPLEVVSIPAGASCDRLSVLGLVPGSEIRLRQRRPAYLIRVGETDVAVDPEIAGEIYVQTVPSIS